MSFQRTVGIVVASESSVFGIGRNREEEDEKGNGLGEGEVHFDGSVFEVYVLLFCLLQ